MKKNKLFVVLFAMLLLAVLSVSVYADQDGKDRYCTKDSYGCWVTNEDGVSKDYIMFWTEEARQYIMGDLTRPYTNVVGPEPESKTDKLPL